MKIAHKGVSVLENGTADLNRIVKEIKAGSNKQSIGEMTSNELQE